MRAHFKTVLIAVLVTLATMFTVWRCSLLPQQMVLRMRVDPE